MVVRVVTPDFKPENPPANQQVVGMLEDLLKLAKDGRITSAAIAFTDSQGGGGAFGPLDASATVATSLMGALANLQFQMHLSANMAHAVK